jgi:hypothetical protein
MGWEEYMHMERRQLRERREGKLRRASGVALPGESVEGLDLLGEQDQLGAEQGLVPIMDEGGRIHYKHIDNLTTLDSAFRIAVELVEVGWLKERVERRKRGADAPPIPPYLR